MQSVDQIIHARWIISADKHSPDCQDHQALVIHNGLIQAILPSKEVETRFTSKDIQHFPHHALTPGLINSHTHIAMNYFRGLADDLALMDWLNHHIWPAEKQWVNHEFVKDASLFAMAEMIRSGTTCFNDMYFFLEATAEAALIAGIRAHIGITVIEFPTSWAQTTDDYFKKGLAFYEKYRHEDLITTTLAPHAIYTVQEPTLQRVKEIAETHQLRINMHIHETKDEIEQSLAQTGMRPLRRLEKIGFISPNLIAVHMAQINEEDLDIIEKHKPQIVHCPESNMKLASGTQAITSFQARGLNVALGTDGAASNNDLNMIGEMRSAALLAKLETRNPLAISAPEALQLATLNGAKALGIDQYTGSLSVGKSADFIAINLDEIETQPLYHPISQIVYAASRHQVSDVWVKGKRLMKNRELLTLDENALKTKAKSWAEKIRSKDTQTCA